MNYFKILIKQIILCTLFLGIVSISHAQPAVEFIRTFHGSGDENFQDIYAVSDSGFIMCGYTRDNFDNWNSFVVRTDCNGETIWSRIYDFPNISNSIIETDEGGFLIGGSGGSFGAMLIDGDGDVIWHRNYGDGVCEAVIELKNGNFLLGGIGGGGRLILIDVEGDPIWDRSDYQGGSRIYALRETDGEAVAAGYGWLGQELRYWTLKVNLEEGEEIWNNLYDHDAQGLCYSLVSSGDGGFALGGGETNRVTLIKIASDGREQFHQRYQRLSQNDMSYCLVKTDDDGYAFVGRGYVGGDDRIRALTIRTTAHGDVRWSQIYDLGEDERFTGESSLWSVVVGYDGAIIAAGSALRRDNGEGLGKDAIIMKLAPEMLHPMVIYHVPNDTVLSVLPGDTTQFIVVAEDEVGQELEYNWFLGESAIAGDTTVTIHWDELGEYLVQCRVANDEYTATVNWHVTVTRLYIDTHSPDSLDIVVRRNTAVDFEVSTRLIGGGFPDYEWRLDGEVLEDAFRDNISILFEHGRNHEVEAWAYLGELSDNVIWQVSMMNMIVDYWPQQLYFEATTNTIIEFMIEPFDPQDESLNILWTVNGDSIGNRTWAFIDFDSIGEQQVAVFVSDSVSSDSMSWTIQVNPNSVDSHDISLLPDIPTLYPPTPNPFNSQTTVRYALPVSGQVRLELFDINGRLVYKLIDQHHAIGWYHVAINCDQLVSGVYFIKMTTDRQVHTQKVLLLR